MFANDLFFFFYEGRDCQNSGQASPCTSEQSPSPQSPQNSCSGKLATDSQMAALKVCVLSFPVLFFAFVSYFFSLLSEHGLQSKLCFRNGGILVLEDLACAPSVLLCSI